MYIECYYLAYVIPYICDAVI